MPDAPEPAEFSEKLWPSPGIWAVTVGFGAALGLVPLPISGTAALITAVSAVVVLVISMIVTTPTVTVTRETFTAGRATVPMTVVGAVEVLDAAQMRQARGVDLDARAYLCIRGWLPAGVRVRLVDAQDPTPYWLVSSRRPDALADAVRGGTGQARIDRTSRSS